MYEPASYAASQAVRVSQSVAPMGERHSQQELATSVAITRKEERRGGPILV
jgi:hypothetical protein